MLLHRVRGVRPMRSAAQTNSLEVPVQYEKPEPEPVTLLELVDAVCDVTDDEREVVATVLHMLRSGAVKLCGNFRGAKIDDLV
jgi:hypothetical protein